MKILPKINLEFNEFRKLAKTKGFKVKSKTLGFEGDLRKVWVLIHIDTNTVIDPFSIVSPEKMDTFKSGYELLKEVTRH